MAGQTKEPGTRSKFPSVKPRKIKGDKDSLEAFNKKEVRVVDEKGQESKADTRVFKIGGTPIDRFRGSESAEFAIMRLFKKTKEYQEQKLLHASDTDREIDAIGILKAAGLDYENKAFEIITNEQRPVFELLDESRYKPAVLERYFTLEQIQAIQEATKTKEAKDERGIVVGDVLELMLLRVELPDGQKYSLIDEVQTSNPNGDGTRTNRKEIYGSKKTPPYRVIEQDVPGHGKTLWVKPAFPETLEYFDSLGEYISSVRKNKEVRNLTNEEKNTLIVYAQLHQQGAEDDFNILALGTKLTEGHHFQKGDNVYGGILPEEQLDDSLNNYFFDRVKSETKTPIQTPQVPADPNAETRKVPSRRIKKNGTTSFRKGFESNK